MYVALAHASTQQCTSSSSSSIGSFQAHHCGRRTTRQVVPPAVLCGLLRPWHGWCLHLHLRHLSTQLLQMMPPSWPAHAALLLRVALLCPPLWLLQPSQAVAAAVPAVALQAACRQQHQPCGRLWLVGLQHPKWAAMLPEAFQAPHPQWLVRPHKLLLLLLLLLVIVVVIAAQSPE